jgi:hypothetical protein
MPADDQRFIVRPPPGRRTNSVGYISTRSGYQRGSTAVYCDIVSVDVARRSRRGLPAVEDAQCQASSAHSAAEAPSSAGRLHPAQPPSSHRDFDLIISS